MNFTVKTFIPGDDYEALVSWWKSHGWTPLPLEFLPFNGLVIEEKDTGKCCMGFIICTDSAYCLMEFIVSNPEISVEKRSLSVDLLIEKLCEKASQLGFKAAFSTTNNPSLLRRCERQGFKVIDTNVTHILRGL